jgi:hypothetical protein
MTPKPTPSSLTVTRSLLSTISALTVQVAALGLAFEAVLDGVLDHRLQHHRREGRAAQALGHAQAHVEAFFHAHLEQVEIGAGHVEFASEVAAQVGVAHLRDHRAQVLDQAALHGRGARRVGLDQVLDRGQGIEQEVRLDLGLHRLHPRFRHLALHRFALGRRGGGLHLGLGALLAAHQGLGAEQRQHQQPDEAGEPGRGLLVVAARLGFGGIVDGRLDRVRQFFADLRRQVDVDFLAVGAADGLGDGMAARAGRARGRRGRRRRDCGGPEAPVPSAGLAWPFPRPGRLSPWPGGLARTPGRRGPGLRRLGGRIDADGCAVALALARIDVDAVVVDDDGGLVAPRILFDARDVFFAAGEQLVLQDLAGDQHQRGEQEELPPRQMGNPGRHRVEPAVGRGQGVRKRRAGSKPCLHEAGLDESVIGECNRWHMVGKKNPCRRGRQLLGRCNCMSCAAGLPGLCDSLQESGAGLQHTLMTKILLIEKLLFKTLRVMMDDVLLRSA